jgi:hypothetical protein
MSLRSLQEIQKYEDEQERATDRHEAQQAKLRRQKLTEEELKAQTQKLVAVVMDLMTKKLPTEVRGKWAWQIIMKTVRPEQVYDNAAQALKQCGLEAYHAANDGYNRYDVLTISIDKETYKKMVLSLFA